MHVHRKPETRTWGIPWIILQFIVFNDACKAISWTLLTYFHSHYKANTFRNIFSDEDKEVREHESGGTNAAVTKSHSFHFFFPLLPSRLVWSMPLKSCFTTAIVWNYDAEGQRRGETCCGRSNVGVKPFFSSSTSDGSTNCKWAEENSLLVGAGY